MPDDLDKSGPIGIAVLRSTTSHARNASQTKSLISSVIELLSLTVGKTSI